MKKRFIDCETLKSKITDTYKRVYGKCYTQAVHDLYNMVISHINRQSSEGYGGMYIIGSHADYDKEKILPEEAGIDVEIPELPEGTLIITHEDFLKALRDREDKINNGSNNR